MTKIHLIKLFAGFVRSFAKPLCGNRILSHANQVAYENSNGYVIQSVHVQRNGEEKKKKLNEIWKFTSA